MIIKIQEKMQFKEKLQTSQGGFLRKRSTLDQVYFLLETMKANPGLIQVFLDFRSAYDLVDRRILWRHLATRFNFPGNLLKMLQVMFDSNESKLLINGVLSTAIPNLRGLPQGSSLSPTLFNFFIDSLICELLENGSSVEVLGLQSNNLLFADDANIHANSSEDLQKLLDICHNWSLRNGMIFAPEKCLVLAKSPATVFLGEAQLQQVHTAMYLGIPLDVNGINTKLMMDRMASNAVGTAMGIIKAGFGSSHWPDGIKISVYKQFVRPIMEYGLQLVHLTKQRVAFLEKVQMKIIRLFLQLPWNTSIQAIRRLFLVESISCRNAILNAKFVRRVEGLNENLPVVQLVKRAQAAPHTIVKSYIRSNAVFRRIQNTENLQSCLLNIRYEDIRDATKGSASTSKTSIADAIYV